MSFLGEVFEWAEKFDTMVDEARKAGKKTISIKVPKKTSKDMQLAVVTRAGHNVKNPKSNKTWNIEIDVTKNKLPKAMVLTTVSFK